MDEMLQTLKRFAGLFRQRTPSWTILLPLLVVALSWPLLQIWLQDEAASFMAAFVLAMGLRLALRLDGTIQALRGRVMGRSLVILMLVFGPGLLAALIWIGEPIWCQRFLSLYFLIMAGLYLLDVVDGRHAMVRHFLPIGRKPGTEALMTRVMAIYHMALLLLNETMIAQTSLTVWLVYFGLLPLLSHRVLVALVRTVNEAHASGLGRL